MNDTPRDPRELLPLTPAALHILLALAEGDKHGYAIHKEILERTGGRVALSIGTLYATLRRLLGEGLVAKADRRPDRASDERRQYYRLTPFGRRVAAAELGQLEEAISTARARRLIPSARESGS